MVLYSETSLLKYEMMLYSETSLLTYEMISYSSQLDEVLQVVMAKDFSAAGVHATIGYPGNLLPWGQVKDIMMTMALGGKAQRDKTTSKAQQISCCSCTKDA